MRERPLSLLHKNTSNIDYILLRWSTVFMTSAALLRSFRQVRSSSCYPRLFHCSLRKTDITGKLSKKSSSYCIVANLVLNFSIGSYFRGSGANGQLRINLNKRRHDCSVFFFVLSAHSLTLAPQSFTIAVFFFCFIKISLALFPSAASPFGLAGWPLFSADLVTLISPKTLSHFDSLVFSSLWISVAFGPFL